MAFRIAIVEDNEETARLLQGYVAKHAAESGDIFDVIWFSDGDEIASDYRACYDIIFMDIQMKRLDGMKTAEIIRKMDKNVILIFITNMAKYAIRGYAVDAMDFLLKPVPYFAFSQQIKRSVEKIKKRQTSFLLLPSKNGVVKMDVSQILYIESFRHKMEVCTTEGVFSLVSTMKELENKLLSEHFYRCNNGYLVNLSFVKGINGNTVTVGGFNLIISRARKKSFMEALAGYVGNA